MFDESVVFDNPIITEKEKQGYRKKISKLGKLDLVLDDHFVFGSEVCKADKELLTKIAKSEDPTTQRTIIQAFKASLEEEYHEKLRSVASNDFISYCEYMNPEEPPAFHHRFMGTKLMLSARRKIKRLAISMPPGFAKALSLTTVVNTPDGPSTIGDLEVGDEVFSSTGRPVKVVRKSPIFYGKKVFRVWTSDNRSVVCDEDHLWTVVRDGRHVTLKASELYGSHHILPAFSPLKYEKRHQKVPPSTMGLWLSDSASEIPPEYLYSDVDDRLAFVDGVVSSDQTTRKADVYNYTTTSAKFSHDFCILLSSLNLHNNIYKSGNKYRVCFRLNAEIKRAIWFEREKSVPTQCITVNSDDGLFLAGESNIVTHNSTYASKFFPSWYMGNNPSHKIIGAGHTQSFVENEFSKKIRDIIDSDRYRKVFPSVRLKADSAAVKQWMNTAGGSYLARGVKTGISGFRGNMAVFDDPYASRKDAESPTVTKDVYDWFMSDLLNRLLPGAPLFVVATRWNNRDLMATIDDLNKNTKGLPWEVINLPAEATLNDPLGRSPGEWLWPDFYTEEEMLIKKETLPTRDWNSLFQGKPVSEGDGMLALAWIHRYKKLPKDAVNDEGKIIRKEVRRTVMSIDTAYKEDQRHDPTCITVWLEDVYGNHYLKDVIVKRVDFNGLVKLINAACKKHRPNAILMEDKGAGTSYIQLKGNRGPAPIIPINVGGKSKEFRFDAVTPMFEAGEVLLPERATWLTDFETELLDFPNAPHDDQVDATSQYLSWARPKRRGGMKKLTGIGFKKR